MGYCVARDSNKPDNKCGEDTPAGFKYCEKHKDRPRAIKEAQEREVHNILPIKQGTEEGVVALIPKREKDLTAEELLKEVTDMVNRTIAFEEFAFNKVQALDGEWRYTDKVGGEQLRGELVVYERAADRVARVLTNVTKLGIDAQLANASRQQVEIVRSVLSKTLARLGLPPDTIKQARDILAEEFAKVSQVS